MTNADAVTTLPLSPHLTAGRIATPADLRHRYVAEVLWFLPAIRPVSRHDAVPNRLVNVTTHELCSLEPRQAS